MTRPTRTEQRKARTRAALIAAAQQLLAEGRAEVSIQEITDRADVGFGSFYNYFSDKSELWSAAITETLTAYGALVATLTAHIEDAAEAFCIGLRLSGRLQPVAPQLKPLLHTGIADLLRGDGLSAYALAHLRKAIDAGRFDINDAELALAITTGALLGLLQTIETRPEADRAALTDETALRVLIAFGLRRSEAKRLVSRSLPEVPSERSAN